MAAPVKAFNFSEEIVHELTNGDCWFLAAGIHHRIGLPYAAIWGDDEIQHVGIELPNGNVVDVEGVWEPFDWETRWADELEDVWGVTYGNVDADHPDYSDRLATHDPNAEKFWYGSRGDGSTLETIISKIMSIVPELSETRPA